MSTFNPEKKESISLKVLYWITSAFYFMLIGGAILFTISRLLALWDIDFTFGSTLGFTLDTSLVDPMQLNLNENLPPIKVTRISGSIDVKDVIPWFAHTLSLLGIIMISSFVFVLNRLRLFMSNIKDDKIFNLANTTYLHQAAYALIVYGVINDVIMRILFAWYFREFDQIKHGIGMDEIFFNNGFIFAMVLIVFAAIFKRGILLKNEVELTI